MATTQTMKHMTYSIKGIKLAILVLFVLWTISAIVSHDESVFQSGDVLKIVVFSLSVIALAGATVWAQFHLFKGSLLGLIAILIFDIFDLMGYHLFSPNLITHLYMLSFIGAIMIHLFNEIIMQKELEISMIKKEYDHLERSHEITKAMMEVTPKMLLDDNIDRLLQNILEIAVELVPNSESGSILVKNEDDIMEFHAAVGYDLSMLKDIHLRFEDTYQYRLQQFYGPTVISDLKTFNEANPSRNVAQEFAEKKTELAASVLTCGVMFQNEIYGFINLDNMDNQDAFDDQDKLLIKHLASQIEIALNNRFLVEKIYQLSQYDSLTGVYSREYYDKMMQSYVKDEQVSFSYAMLDVNDLKKINDTYGHFVGDQYIVHFVHMVQANLTSNDHIYRTGGDEFAIIMIGVKLQDGLKKMEKIRDYITGHPFMIDDTSVPITFGCGVAHYQDDHEDLQMVIRMADKRMYEDKKAHK